MTDEKKIMTADLALEHLATQFECVEDFGAMEEKQGLAYIDVIRQELTELREKVELYERVDVILDEQLKAQPPIRHGLNPIGEHHARLFGERIAREVVNAHWPVLKEALDKLLPTRTEERRMLDGSTYNTIYDVPFAPAPEMLSGEADGWMLCNEAGEYWGRLFKTEEDAKKDISAHVVGWRVVPVKLVRCGEKL